MRLPILSVPALMTLAIPLAWSQNLSVTQPALPLSMKRAVEIALAPDGSTRAALAQEAIDQAAQRVIEAKAAFLPSLDAAVQDHYQTVDLKAYGFGFNFAALGFSLPTLVGPFNVLDARAYAQQSVLNFSDIHKYQAAKATLAAVKLDNDSTRNSVADEVARAYLACLRADADRDTAQANVELSTALLQLAQRQKTAGTGTGIDVTRAEVQLANDRQRLIHAGNERTRTVLQLLKTMGLSLGSPIEFTDKLTYKPVDATNAESLLDQARKTRPELKTQQQREQAAHLTYSAVTAERLPTIGATADYGAIGSDVVSARGTYTLGVSLKIPVFDGFRRGARREESFSQFRQEQIRTRDVSQQIELQVRVALESLRSAAAEVDAAREGLTLAESELAQARRRFEAGVAASLEVTDAQTRLQRARDNQVNALYNHNAARLDLATATGTIGDFINQ